MSSSLHLAEGAVGCFSHQQRQARLPQPSFCFGWVKYKEETLMWRSLKGTFLLISSAVSLLWDKYNHRVTTHILNNSSFLVLYLLCTI